MEKLKQLWLLFSLIFVTAYNVQGQTTIRVKARNASGREAHIAEYKASPDVNITRRFMGKDIIFPINPAHPGGRSVVVWQETIIDGDNEITYTISQLSSTVLLYNARQTGVVTDRIFDPVCGPMKLEFMDPSCHTLREIDLWAERPYRSAESVCIMDRFLQPAGWSIMPYDGEDVFRSEDCMYVYVRSVGNQVLVNYQLVDLINKYQVAGLHQSLTIYDTQGDIRYSSNDLPIIDWAVLSADGRYLLYNLAYYDMIDGEGWTIRRVADDRIMYSESITPDQYYFMGFELEDHLVKVTFQNTNNDNEGYNYWVLFDSESGSLYRYRPSLTEMDVLAGEIEAKKISNKLRYFLQRLDFESLSIGE